MDLTFDESQDALRELAAELFAKRSPVARVTAVEATEERVDRELWADLGGAGLLGVALPEELGGAGLGLVEAAIVCVEQGRVVAPVPLLWTIAAARVLAHAALVSGPTPVPVPVSGVAAADPDPAEPFGSAEPAQPGGSAETQHPTGSTEPARPAWAEDILALLRRVVAGAAILTCAPEQVAAPLRVTATGPAAGRVSGRIAGVPYAHVADRILLPIGADGWLIDPSSPGATVRSGPSTSGELHGELELDDVPALRLPGAATDLRAHLLVLLAALAAGVTAAALQMAAEHTSTRTQFGRPLSTFQGVALKAADAYVDTVGISATAMQAAWRLDQGLDAAAEILTAAWWAAEAGQHCVHLTQHLHGGLGADVSYPVHRYFLWGKQIELLTGGASALLSELGDTLVHLDDPGDAC
ncbi:Acyl-CoA dehydrogenase [Parafrankia irregularis]|uniref:Acyl-CoA dehydrogenase n=1 Tax=Parafrankia irregularis TaxID=795642 RepID=A0A0S4QLU5_9ACTN|nr:MULTISPECIES: acyl-CoA dehydrogenase family protein [Parafrankia]MBE3202325.1 acyl-CoA/acyl-ACP dehydrogenase [Parafrankia sp. CH37]CUU56078.1 Acyl-CoA dehydrogenase [Parafrankia irregularis]